MTRDAPNSTLAYQSPTDRRAEGERRVRRVLSRMTKVVAWALGGLIATVVLLVGGQLLYWQFRTRTTVQQVEGWVASLPPDAAPKDVKALFAAKGMECDAMAADSRYGWPPADYDPWEQNGLMGRLRNADSGFLWVREITVVVRFDRNNRVKSVRVMDESKGL